MALKMPTSATATQAGAVTGSKPGRRVRRNQMFTVLGGKDTGKSSNLSTIPKRDGQKHAFLTADHTTKNGITRFTLNRLLAEDPSLRDAKGAAVQWVEDNIKVYELLEYYDPSDSASAPGAAAHVLSCFDEAKKEASEGRVGLTAVEHYDVLFNKLGVDLVRAEYLLDRDAKIQYTMYGERSRFMDPLDSLIETIPSDLLFLVGQGEELKEVVKGTGKFRKGRNGEDVEITEIKQELVLPRWLTKRNIVRNSLAQIQLTEVRQESETDSGTKVFKDAYLAQVITSKHLELDTGRVYDVTNKGLAEMFAWYKPGEKDE